MVSREVARENRLRGERICRAHASASVRSDVNKISESRSVTPCFHQLLAEFGRKERGMGLIAESNLNLDLLDAPSSWKGTLQEVDNLHSYPFDSG